MADSGGKGRRKERNQSRAMEMKRLGIERTTGRCPICYRMVTVDSSKSRYTHICGW